MSQKYSTLVIGHQYSRICPIDGCFEDGFQLWPLFSDVNCRLPPVIDGCFKDVLQQWPLFFVVDCRLPSDGSPGLKKTRVFLKKPTPVGFIGFNWALGFIGFFAFLRVRLLSRILLR